MAQLPLAACLLMLCSSLTASTTRETESALVADDACHEGDSCSLELLHLRAQKASLDVQVKGKWCDGAPAAKLWPAAQEGGELAVKILSYNLFWWNLFGIRRGNGNSAGKLIQASMGDKPFDVMGFQECDDGRQVLGPVGLLAEYEMFQGDHAVCVAWKKTWSVLDKGTDDVGEDMKTHYYGKRGAVWVRLKHGASGRTMLFVNHHGPLEINSGGECGGEAVASNIAKLMHRHGKPGDILILVGDFNANSASVTVQEMWARLVLIHTGDSFGGVDNIFGNMDTGSILEKKTLGSGGSDHHAIMATVRVGSSARRLSTVVLPPADAASAAQALSLEPPKDDWQHFWCGRLESDTEYSVPEGTWSHIIGHNPRAGDAFDVASPQRCCRLCQRDSKCKSWTWVTWASTGPECRIFGAPPSGKKTTATLVSGLPATYAASLAASMAKKTSIVTLEGDEPIPIATEEAAPAIKPAHLSCQDALPGDSCFVEVQWAKTDGIGAHPDWYPGLTPASSVKEFQAMVHASAPDKCPTPCASCVNAQEGDGCYDEVHWAMTTGISQHPDWYPGLSAASSPSEFQAAVHAASPDKCAAPCAATLVPEAPAAPAGFVCSEKAAAVCAGPDEKCFYDPMCLTSGGVGCNAGGHKGCRFCDMSGGVACP
eukprot:TRINITY_DN1840_c0_g1_i1.p1 TRINITY_DN1840_c0_g1~~TRINITY_DN1840_c0_g1_i1.p1  ORF type:complete len:672 (-),score=126.08 TRINITY_DN1840_c0_g1_i1:42-2006(-)